MMTSTTSPQHDDHTANGVAASWGVVGMAVVLATTLPELGAHLPATLIVLGLSTSVICSWAGLWLSTRLFGPRRILLHAGNLATASAVIAASVLQLLAQRL